MKKRTFSLIVAVCLVFSVFPVIVSANGGGCLEIDVNDLMKSDGAASLSDGVLTYAGRTNYGHVYVFFDVPNGFSLSDYSELTLTVEGIAGDLYGKSVRLNASRDIIGGWHPDNFWFETSQVASSSAEDIVGVNYIYIPLTDDFSAFDGITRYALYIHANSQYEDVPTEYKYSNIRFKAAGCNNNCITCDPSSVTETITEDEIIVETVAEEAEEPTTTAESEETIVPEPNLNVVEDSEPGLLGLAIGVPVFGAFSGFIATRKPKKY